MLRHCLRCLGAEQTELVHPILNVQRNRSFKWWLDTSILPEGDFFLSFLVGYARSSGGDEAIPDKRSDRLCPRISLSTKTVQEIRGQQRWEECFVRGASSNRSKGCPVRSKIFGTPPYATDEDCISYLQYLIQNHHNLYCQQSEWQLP